MDINPRIERPPENVSLQLYYLKLPNLPPHNFVNLIIFYGTLHFWGALYFKVMTIMVHGIAEEPSQLSQAEAGEGDVEY
jgi:hypothetical protein